MINKIIRHPLWAFVVWPLVVTVLVFPYRINGSINIHDEGVWLAAVQALLEGKKLYGDVWFQYGPLLLAPIRATFSFFPTTLSLVRSIFWFENWLGLLAVTLCVLKFVKNPLHRLLFTLFVFMVPSASHVPCIPMAARYGMGFLSVLFWPPLPTHKERENAIETNGHPLLSGVAAGMALFASQETGLAAFLSGLVVFILARQKNSAWIRFVLGFFAVAAGGWLIIAQYASLGAYFNCTFPGIATLVADQSVPFPRLRLSLWINLMSGQGTWRFAWQNLADVAAAYGPPVILLGSAIGVWKLKEIETSLKNSLIGLTLFSALMMVPAFGRSDRWHIYMGLTPTVLLIGLWQDIVKKFVPKIAPPFLLAGLLSLSLLFIPHFLTSRARDRFFAKMSRESTLPRAGSVCLPVFQANGYELLGAWVQAKISPQEPVLFYPYNGAFYFLVNRPNPSRYPILSYAARVPVQERVARELAQANVQWIVWDTDNTTFDGKPISKYLEIIDTYIRREFEPKDAVGSFEFWRRKAPKEELL